MQYYATKSFREINKYNIRQPLRSKVINNSRKSKMGKQTEIMKIRQTNKRTYGQKNWKKVCNLTQNGFNYGKKRSEKDKKKCSSYYSDRDRIIQYISCILFLPGSGWTEEKKRIRIRPLFEMNRIIYELRKHTNKKYMQL